MPDSIDIPVSASVAALLAAGVRIRTAPSPVSHAAIRGWCHAIGLTDSRFTGEVSGPDATLIAPPPMMQSWAGAGLASIGAAGSVATLHHDVRQAFRDAGFSSVVATNYEQHFYRDLVPGDVVEEHSWVQDISPRKTTRLGTGHFVRIGFLFHDRASGMLVGEQLATTFYYVPADRTAESHATVSPPPGHLRNPLSIALTPTLVIAGAIASNDYEKVHHDRESALADGLPDVILSIITSAGLVLRYLADHAGRRDRLRSLRLRLGAPASPGDALLLSSDALASQDDEEGLQVRGIVGDRLHLDAEARFEAPGADHRILKTTNRSMEDVI